ncbi:wax ester/triacylglycerol synthase family O-acyltransferase [Aquabacterium sp.]|uniref:wax ester/triacylglycerol synthase family O-acyltransferase n=1 Tax=Aquabacterium sp. TaxID=1872578 RepID=UPI002BD7F654|nr:wax ester/triacylglycerol synthase family O-acyltransferase [Aquabacterium sp.]HSW06404.1 wax ester/triacylglycerol synthase family O-acyltransferase [Aquabacterium sp.]
MKDLKHLSIVDGAFLHFESAEMPMHVGSSHVFELPAGYTGNWYDDVRAHIAGRMHLAPVFTRKLAMMPFDLANPVWIDDDDIDLDYHMRYVMLPKPGTREQMDALVARLHSSLLDRSRPLWEFYVIDGLASGHMGFYGKVHHAAIDGQAGVTLGQSIFDLTPEPRKVKPPRPRRSHRYQLGVAELLSAGIENQLNQVVTLGKLVPGLAKSLMAMVVDAVQSRAKPAANGSKGTKAGSLLKFAPPSPFNHPITNQRAFTGLSLPLDETKRVGKALGASVNDMVLWLCSTALRGYLKDSRELPDKTLVAGVPISLREQGDTSMNNQVTGTLVDLGTQLADPMKRLATIMAGTAAMKKQMGTFSGVVPTDFPSLGSPWLLSGLASLYGRSRLADRLRFANVTISNVPGAPVPVYLAGAKMMDYYPVSIVVHGVALNITVQSYMGQLCFGLIACRRAMPDVADLAAHMRKAFEAMKGLMPAATEEAAKPAALAAANASAKPVAEAVAKPVPETVAKPVVEPVSEEPVKPVKAVKPRTRKVPVRAAVTPARAPRQPRAAPSP